MEEIIIILCIILFLVVGYAYASNVYYKQLKNWNHEVTVKKVWIYFLPILIKSVIALSFVILVHNAFHDDHILELTLFILIFFLFSIFQSAFSVMGFYSRVKHMYGAFTDYFRMSSSKMNKSLHEYALPIKSATFLLRFLVIVGFVVVFIPNFSLFLTVNIIFILFIGMMIILSLLLNNIIYFGMISLFVFQLEEASISFTNIPYLMLFVSFFIIVVGVTLETRLERRMFDLIRVLPVKRLNFKLGYNVILDKKDIIVYQNYVNGYYYIYFRKVGVVNVYYTMYDAKTSDIVINKMIQYGKRYLTNNNID